MNPKLTLPLTGINNQNFLMREEESGTVWQRTDELTFALWKSEQPQGTLVSDAARFTPRYARKEWDAGMQKAPTVLSYAQHGLTPRTRLAAIIEAAASQEFSAEPAASQVRADRSDAAYFPSMIV